MNSIVLEICCGSIDDASEAEMGGADRVELCSALFLGGLTPSIGTIQEAKHRLKIPVMAMVRPRGGGFCYTEAEMATMERDTSAAIDSGADGIVFGILLPDGKIDLARCKRICRLTGNRQAVFHRAIDVTPDPFEALNQLIDLGVTRILTSGAKDSAPEGASLIRQLIERAAGRIEIMPGGGIHPYQVRGVVEETGCKQIHLTAWKTATDSSTHANTAVTFGGALFPPEDRYQVVDPGAVRDLTSQLK